jgi:spermidine synthase
LNQNKILLSRTLASGDLIEVVEHNNLRYLYINQIEQSRIDIHHPEQLTAPLHRCFLASLLFRPLPKTVLLGGLGGGAIARYLHHTYPEIQGCAVEINKDITAIARDYFFFPEKSWKLVIGDIQQYDKGCYDLIILDIADHALTPNWLTSEKMLVQLRSQLSSDGVLAINLLPEDASSFQRMLMMIRSVFMRRTLCVSVPGYTSIVVFAFNQQPQHFQSFELKSRAHALTMQCGFDFSMMVEQIYKDNPKGSGVI